MRISSEEQKTIIVQLMGRIDGVCRESRFFTKWIDEMSAFENDLKFLKLQVRDWNSSQRVSGSLSLL